MHPDVYVRPSSLYVASTILKQLADAGFAKIFFLAWSLIILGTNIFRYEC